MPAKTTHGKKLKNKQISFIDDEEIESIIIEIIMKGR